MANGGAHALERGRFIGKYRILTRLSVGGMAELFLAVVTGPGGFRKFVAVKHILPDLKEDEEFVNMFLDEARISATLSHANIAQVFDLGGEGADLFIAMEFVPGKDLAAITRSCRRVGRILPFGFSGMVVRDLCLALHYAHHFTDPLGNPSPIIHRDISPNNVMVTYSSAVKVIDFGIAKARGSVRKTREGLIKGSHGYMSPEQVRGDALDGRSDLFSAGVLLHELLTGRKLFRVESDLLLTMQRILFDDIPPPHEQNPEVPPALSSVVMRSLARNPDDRFADGREFARALESALGDQLYDVDRGAGLMRELFEDSMEKTRRLLEFSGLEADDKSLVEAARVLQEEASKKPKQPTVVVEPKPQKVKTAPEHVSVGGASPGATTPRPSGPAATILTVDDSDLTRRIIEVHLLKEGFRVLGCASADEALELLKTDPPDLMLLDVMMPGVDGFELCRLVRERSAPRYIPILFLSSACSLDERLKGLTVGGDDFIRKPYEPDELTGRVRAHLQRVSFLHQVNSAQPR